MRESRVVLSLIVFALLVGPRTAAAQGAMSSPSFSADCLVVVPAEGDIGSPSFGARAVVGGSVVGQASSPSFSVEFGAGCGADPGCGVVLCGDCDGNGIVNILDALLSAQHAVALVVVPAGPRFESCDVDNDADIDVLNSLRLAQFAAGLPVSLTCC